MVEARSITVDISLSDDHRTLCVRPHYGNAPLNILGVQPPIKDGETIQIRTSEIAEVDHNRCKPAPSMVRHFASRLTNLQEVSICSQGTMSMRFDEPLHEQQLDELAELLVKHLTVMVPLTTMMALQ
jgi:hypothetical protein